MTDRVVIFSKEEYKDEKIRIYITVDGLFQSNFTGDDNFEVDVDCLERAKHNIDTGNIKIKKKVNIYKDYQEKVKKEKRIAEGWYKDNKGYILIKCPDHPFAHTTGHILKHRVVLEEWLRKNKPNHPALIEVNDIKYLNPEWLSHHKNGKKDDNNIGNLMPVTTKQHRYLHTSKGLLAFLKKNPDVKISKEYHIG